MALSFVKLFDLWETVGGHNRYRVARLYPTNAGESGGWTDIAGQTDTKIQNRSGAFCGLTLGKLDESIPASAALLSDSRFLVIIRYEADTSTPSFDNRTQTVTVAHLNAFTTYFNTQLGFNISALPSMQNAVGKQRQQVLADVLVDLQALT